MENSYFVKLWERSSEFKVLIKQRPTAFVLLAVIAVRARKVPLKIDDGIKVGEAFIGDCEEYGATAQTYRTDKKYLEKMKIATFKPTNKGTIAMIVNSSIFDISRVSSTSKLTDQQQSNNMQSTTKQEVRSESKEESQAKPMGKKDFFHDIPLTPSPISPKTASIPYKDKVSEAYWDKYAPWIADELDIDQESWQFINGKRDWLKKANIATLNSIKKFLQSANDWDELKGI